MSTKLCCQITRNMNRIYIPKCYINISSVSRDKTKILNRKEKGIEKLAPKIYTSSISTT